MSDQDDATRRTDPADDPGPDAEVALGPGFDDIGAGEDLAFYAEASFYPAAELAHPNCQPFKAVLHQVDQPSTRAPHGAQGHRVMVPRAVAERRVSTLINMGLNASVALDGHQVTKKIGVITAAAVGKDPKPELNVPGFTVDPNAVMIAGCLYANDFPREVAAIRAAAARGTIGASYETAKTRIRDRNAPVWELADLVYTGAAALERRAAAYEDTRLAASGERKEDDPMTTPNPDPNPAPAPAPSPAPEGGLDDKIKAAIAAAVTAAVAPLQQSVESIRSEVGSRMQAVEGALATMRTKPGESPEELQMREQAQALEEQAKQLDPAALTKREEAAALRGENKDDLARQAEQAAAGIETQAATLRAQATTLRAKAFGYGPILHAMGVLVTDGLATLEKKLATELGGKIESITSKLATDPGGPHGAPNNGGPAQPERISLSAAGMNLLSKFPDAPTKGITESELNQAMRARNIPTDQQIGLIQEFGSRGWLRGAV